MFKFLKKLLLIILILVLIVAVVVIIAINMTPRKLKFADKEIINGKTCETMEIADTKFITLIKDFKKITKAKDVVKNPYDATKEESSTKTMMDDFGFTNTNGEIDYEKLYNSGLDQNSEFLYSYDDTTVAYLVNNLLQYAAEDGDLEILKKFNAKLSEITFDGTNKKMRAVFELDIKEFKDGFDEKMPKFIAKLVGIPEKIYVVSYLNVDVNSEGKLVLEHDKVLINDLETKLSDALFIAISSDEMTVKDINNQFGDAIEEAISCLGKVGIATANENHQITGSSSYGIEGYQDGKISMIVGIA